MDCLNAKSSEERVVYKKAELNRNVDSENNHGGSSRTYVLHRTGCSQEDDQLLRQGCERSGSPGRPDRSNTLGWWLICSPSIGGNVVGVFTQDMLSVRVRHFPVVSCVRCTLTVTWTWCRGWIGKCDGN